MRGNDLPAMTPGHPGVRVQYNVINTLIPVRAGESHLAPFHCGVVVDGDHRLFQQLERVERKLAARQALQLLGLAGESPVGTGAVEIIGGYDCEVARGRPPAWAREATRASLRLQH